MAKVYVTNDSPSWRGSVRLVIQDLNHRSWETLYCLMAMIVLVWGILVFGFHAYQSYNYQAGLVDDVLLRKVKISLLPHIDSAAGFSPAKIAELESWPEVCYAAAYREQSGLLSGCDQEELRVNLIGVGIYDPALGAERFLWGSVWREPAEQAIVLSQKMNKLLCQGARNPETVTAHFYRTKDGVEQNLRRTYRVLGVTHDKDERAYVSFSELEYIAAWLSHRQDIYISPDPQPQQQFAYGRVFVDHTVTENHLDEISVAYHVTFEKVYAPISSSPAGCRIMITRPEGKPINVADLKLITELISQADCQGHRYEYVDHPEADRQSGHPLVRSMTMIFNQKCPCATALGKLLTTRGFQTRLNPLGADDLQCYRFHAQTGYELDQKLADLLREEPGFYDPEMVRSLLASPVKNSDSWTVVSANRKSRLRRVPDLIANGWFRQSENPWQVVLPKGFALQTKLRVDNTIELVFRKPKTGQSLILPWKIVGFTSWEQILILPEAARNIARWQQGFLEFSPQKKSWRQSEPSVPVASPRYAVLYLADSDLDKFAFLAAQFSPNRYRLTDRRNELVYLQNLGRGNLVSVMTLVFFGTFWGSLVMFVTTQMNAKVRIRDTGIISVFGGNRGFIYRLFFLQGLIMGVLSFLISVLLAVLSEKPFRYIQEWAYCTELTWLRDASLLSYDVWFIYLAAFLICVVCSVLATVLVAASVVRKPLAEILRSGE